ncbi:MAG: HK97 gp10 family phage protein [Clostridiales bacterium]|nr:HK97 gp10 family phage protein [Clostridiales bacterium]
MATIEIKNADRLIQKLNNISNMDLVNTMNKATELVHAQAKTLAPVDTGNLAGSIHLKVLQAGTVLQGKVYTNLSYAPYVEFGTGSKGNGTYPNKKLGLTYRSTPWVYTPNGEDFYRTEGQVAQPYMYPAIQRNKKHIKEMFKVGVDKNLGEICK